MELIYIILGVWILYSRTWLAKDRPSYIIDDNVRRWGYLYVVPDMSPHPQFYSTKPHPWRHFFLIFTHCLNVWLIFHLFGWGAAAIFAFHPISANGTAWITGGYYSVTVFFTLTAVFFLTTYPTIYGGIAACIFLTAAFGSTITCLGVALLYVLFLNPIGAMLLWPMGMFLFGRRFRTGFGIRDFGKSDKVTFRKPAVMMKVMAYYLRIVLFPNRLAFFRKFGCDYCKNEKTKKDMDSYNKHFWQATAVVVSFALIGWQFSPFGTMWFLVTLAPFTQFKVLGQFIAERYLYLPLIGVAMIVGNALVAYPFAMGALVALLISRTHKYIPAFHNVIKMYENGIENYPDCVGNYANLGERHLHMGKTGLAMNIFRRGLELDPTSFLCHTNLAAYYISVKDWVRSAEHSGYGMLETDNPMANRILKKQREELMKKVKEMEEIYGNKCTNVPKRATRKLQKEKAVVGV